MTYEEWIYQEDRLNYIVHAYARRSFQTFVCIRQISTKNSYVSRSGYINKVILSVKNEKIQLEEVSLQERHLQKVVKSSGKEKFYKKDCLFQENKKINDTAARNDRITYFIRIKKYGIFKNF